MVEGALAPEIVGFGLAPQQERLWRLARGGADRARLVLEVVPGGAMDADRARAALAAVVARHDILRTRFESLPGMTVPVQVVDETAVLDWAAFAAEPGRARLEIELPALCADEESLLVIARDFGRALGGPAWSDDEPAVSYAQFAEWQSQMVEDAARHPLAAVATEGGANLPFARPPGTTPFCPRSTSVHLPVGADAGLAALAERLGVDVPSVLLAGWTALILRLGEGRPVVAERFHGREHELLADAVGLFAKWLPLAVAAEAETLFSELVSELAAARDAASQDAAAFLWDAASHPEIGFAVASPLPVVAVDGGELRVVAAESPSDRFALLLRVRPQGEGWTLELQADGGRIDAEDAARLAEQLAAIVAAVLAEPQIPLDRLDLLTPAERLALVAPGSAAFPEPPAEAAVHRRFARVAAAHPERLAVVCGEARLTYGELALRANRLAHRLLRLGVGPDVPVALIADRSVELVVGLLGILQAGGAYVPIEPGQPRHRLASILADVNATVVVGQGAALAALPNLAPSTGAVVDLGDPTLADESGDDPGLPMLPAQLVYVVFTSGSTGRPKGVLVEHRQLAAYLTAACERLDLPADGRYLIVSTFAADLGNTVIFPALCQGATLEIVPAELASDAEALSALAARAPVDVLKIVPSHLQALQAASGAPLQPRRRLVLGGEASAPGWIEELRARAGDCRIFNHYGPSETTVGVLTGEVTGPLDPRAATLPLGKPLPGCRVFLLDPEMRPEPRWTPGEIWIGGLQVARGYAGLPDLTAERFLPDPLSGEPGARLYRTGDLARFLSDGTVEFLGRADHQVKFHGFRIELEEIRALLRRHSQVRDAVARVLRDDQGREVLAAYYLARQPVEAAELRALLAQYLLAETLPNFYVHLRRMPLTLNGKVDYAGLPGLDAIRRLERGGFAAPRSPGEQVLAGLWSEVLGIERVGLHDNFFELGGHSLLATRLASRVRQTFGVELPLRSLFDEPTLAGFAGRIEAALRSGSPPQVPPLTRAPRDRALPLSFAQERLWLMHQLAPASPAYNMPGAFGFRGRLAVTALAAALGEVAGRHEVLRTRFVAADGVPVQVIDPPRPWPLPLVDLSGLDGARREAEARRLAAAEARRPFDLAAGPVLRTVLLRREAEDHVLLSTLHHAAADAWSIEVFVRELTAIYATVDAGRPSPFAPLPLQYGDFAVWQRAWLTGPILDAEVDHWRRQLAGAPERLELPMDRRGSASFAGAVHREPVAAEVWQRIEALARQEKATPFMVVLAAFDALLYRATGATDVVVGTDVANRNYLPLEGMIGFFVNNLVLRTDLSGDPSCRELIARVRETTLRAYAHQDLPFDQLVRALVPRRDLAVTPLFQVLFVLQNAPPWELAMPGIAVDRLDLGVETAKFDLALFLRPAAGGAWSADWTYRTGVFDAATVARLAGRYSTLLSSLLAQPDAHLNELEMVTDMEKQEHDASSLNRLRGARRRSAEPAPADLVEMAPLFAASAGSTGSDDQPLPLVVQPRVRDLDLPGWAAGQRDLLESKLLAHGGLLFRGFQVGGVGEFERFAAAIAPDLYGEYGDLPREEEGGKVYKSTPYPEDKSILFHNESSHMHRWPLKQWFFCVTPSPVGGATPLLDGRRVVRALRPELAAELESKGLIYVRNFTDGLDVSWQEFFRTNDRSAVEAWCHQAGLEYRWKADGLQTRQRARAVAVHPKTGDKVVFNQMQLHHPACLDAETRASLLAVFGEENLPRNVLFGDGSPIPDAVMAEIGELYERLAVRFTWQQGDVVMLDNMLTAHARDPYAGPRKIVVAMGEITAERQLAAG